VPWVVAKLASFWILEIHLFMLVPFWSQEAGFLLPKMDKPGLAGAGSRGLSKDMLISH
jgi:hypothetical protein